MTTCVCFGAGLHRTLVAGCPFHDPDLTTAWAMDTAAVRRIVKTWGTRERKVAENLCDDLDRVRNALSELADPMFRKFISTDEARRVWEQRFNLAWDVLPTERPADADTVGPTGVQE